LNSASASNSLPQMRESIVFWKRPVDAADRKLWNRKEEKRINKAQAHEKSGLLEWQFLAGDFQFDFIRKGRVYT
jgi:hypothetical protein